MPAALVASVGGEEEARLRALHLAVLGSKTTCAGLPGGKAVIALSFREEMRSRRVGLCQARNLWSRESPECVNISEKWSSSSF